MARLNDFLFDVDLNELIKYIETHGTTRFYRKDESM